MILRRLKTHIEKENWFAVFLDFCIVVIGVFVGLQVQAWAQEQERKRQEAVYVLRLYDEVVDLKSARQQLLDSRESVLANLNTAVPVISGEIDRPLTGAECDSVAMSAIVTNPTDDLATLIELQQTGGLTLFRDETVLAEIRAYLLTRARARDVLEGTRDRAGHQTSGAGLSNPVPVQFGGRPFSVVFRVFHLRRHSDT